jgi:hypothetical protein
MMAMFIFGLGMGIIIGSFTTVALMLLLNGRKRKGEPYETP